jgi:S-formylglutathione hydrolase
MRQSPVQTRRRFGHYFEVGDEDMFYLYEAAEYLHRILWDHKIQHE